VEQFPKMEGRQLVMVMSPKKTVPKAVAKPAAKPASVKPAVKAESEAAPPAELPVVALTPQPAENIVPEAVKSETP
jgi:hypothetical protein